MIHCYDQESPNVMRTIVCLGILVAASCPPASAQLLLNPGEAYTYQFSSLPLYQASTPLDSEPGGYWELQTAPISPTTPLRFRLEMFEDSVAQAPIGAVIYESSPAQPAWDAFTCFPGSPYNWQDLQGAVQVTVLEGTLQLNSLSVTAWRPAGEGVDDLFYSGPITIVPEPSARTLLILASCMLGVWIISRKKRRMSQSHHAVVAIYASRGPGH